MLFSFLFSLSAGVWLLWRGDSREKSWHRGVQGFKKDWFRALCLASLLDHLLFWKLGILCTYWRDNPVSYLFTFHQMVALSHLSKLARDEDGGQKTENDYINIFDSHRQLGLVLIFSPPERSKGLKGKSQIFVIGKWKQWKPEKNT